MKKYLSFLAISALVLSAACSATTGEDADGSSTDDAVSGDISNGTDTGADAGADAGQAGPAYKSIVIYDKYTEPDCNKTTGPGPDIDMVALWRGSKLMGVGKVGSCDYSAGTKPACPDNKHAAAKDVQAACGPFGDIDAKSVSFGYLSLGGGSLELQIGACTTETTDFEKCDGAGDVVEILDGDQLDVFEVDKWYTGTNKDKIKYITGACKCIPETYEVWIRTAKGVDTDSVNVGQKTGTDTLDIKIN